MADRFAAICGGETFPYFKPDPRHITLTVERAVGDPARAVMVGDSRADIDAAKAARHSGDRGALRLHRPAGDRTRTRRVIAHFDELGAAVAALVPAA